MLTVISAATGARWARLGIAAILIGACGPNAVATPSASPATAAAPVASSAPPATAPAVTMPPPATAPAAPAPPEPWPLPGVDALPADVTAALDAALARLPGTDAPGVAAAVVTPDGTWIGATGVDGAGRPIEPQSAFGIGSITKTLTAAELLLLDEAGAIDLDEPVAGIVDLPFDAGGATIRQLATMQSGFPALSDPDLEVRVAADLDRRWAIRDLLAGLDDAPRLGTVGGPGRYNGVNYQVLSLVIEAATGEPLATVLRRDLVMRAWLERLWIQADQRPTGPLAIAVDPGPGIVDPDSDWLPSLAAASTGNGAAGAAADAESLADWAYRLYGGHVIDPALVAVMTTPNWASELGYGFGTMCDQSSGTLVVGHAGDYMGYSSVVLAWPETHVAVAVLVPREGLAVSGTVPGWAFELYGVAIGRAGG